MFKLSLKSIIFYKKQYFWILLGLILSAAILSGALTVGSSVKASLHDMAMKRLGDIQTVVDARLNPIQQKFVEGLSAPNAPLLSMVGSASFKDERTNGVAVYGINEEFKHFFKNFPELKPEQAIINQRLAEKLKIKDGEELVLRVQNNSLLPGDLPLTGSSEDQTAIRIKIKILESANAASRFSLHASQTPPEIIFLNLKELQTNSNMVGMINLVLSGQSLEQLSGEVDTAWTPEISGLAIRKVDSDSAWDLTSNRVFLPSEMVKDTSGSKIVTYMANEVRMGEKVIPYSIVSAMNPGDKAGKSFENLPQFSDSEIILNEWTAKELGAREGSKVRLKYYVDNADGKLIEQESEYTVKQIIKIESLDRQLMPSYPGIAEEEHCRDWEPGIPMDLNKIRDVDEKYWETYKGTPKAVITYKAGKEIWGNRFGDTTSIRWPSERTSEDILKELKKAGPQAAGVIVRDIRTEAKKAASQGIDFGMLFLTMSFFIIIAALILTALLLAFHLGKRREEMGIMLSCGFTKQDVRNRFLREGFLLSVIALIPGIPLGIIYTSKIINFLSTIWINAVGTTEIYLKVSPVSLGVGAITFIFFAIITLWLVIRKFMKQHTVELLNGLEQNGTFRPADFRFVRAGIVLMVFAIAAVIIGGERQFATSSFLLLASALFLSHGVLEKIRAGSSTLLLTMGGLVVRSLSRKPARSLGAILLMASGTFIVLNTVARQKTLSFDKSDKKSGTGGYEHFIQTSISLRYKPDSKEGIDEFGLEKELIEQSDFVSFRYHRGDDASCLNLNRAQQPQVYGVNPDKLKGRFNLSGEDWDKLNQELPEGVIPAIGDENTVLWGLALYKGVGSQLSIKDEKGRDVKLQIVAMLKNSILQGTMIVNRANFDNLYPAESGYQVFLLDTPEKQHEEVIESIELPLEDYGLTIQDTEERLRNFLKIEATYLIIFQMLSGLGLILGALGFGFIILRNVQDREGEIATMKAIGFQNNDIVSSLFKEHVLLLLWAVTCGSLTAIISWIPLFVTNAELPLTRILTILALILIVGIISCFLSSRASIKFNFIEKLKNE